MSCPLRQTCSIRETASRRTKPRSAPRSLLVGLTAKQGQITKLKLVKRQMYGRGKLDLLQALVISANVAQSPSKVRQSYFRPPAPIRPAVEPPLGRGPLEEAMPHDEDKLTPRDPSRPCRGGRLLPCGSSRDASATATRTPLGPPSQRRVLRHLERAGFASSRRDLQSATFGAGRGF